MKSLALGLVSIALVLAGCSQVTMLRTQEMKAVGTDVQVAVLSNLDSSVQYLSAQNDSLRAELEASALLQKRMMAEITTLARRMGDESERNDSRQEEIIYRLDMLLGKSDKILAKKVVVSGAPQAPMSMDSLEREAEKLVEAEAMFNTARSDYHRGEYKLAYSGFKQVYEQMKTGELAENSLYWMALCLIDAKQKDKAKKVLTSLSDAFPDGQKTCSAMFKLASLHAEDGEVDLQKQYLQKILNSKNCASSAEFEQAAGILQELLESGPQPEIKPIEAPAQ
jgi:TolA-binding protein